MIRTENQRAETTHPREIAARLEHVREFRGDHREVVREGQHHRVGLTVPVPPCRQALFQQGTCPRRRTEPPVQRGKRADRCQQPGVTGVEDGGRVVERRAQPVLGRVGILGALRAAGQGGRLGESLDY